MNECQETIELTDGLGLLELVGSDYDAALLLNNQPLAFNWCDCQGSIGQYLLNSQIERGFTEQLDELRWLLEGNLTNNSSLAEQLQPMLRLFSNGWYRLALQEYSDWQFLEFSQIKFGITDTNNGVYPYGAEFVATQPRSSLCSSTIERFERFIESGRRPLAIIGTVLNQDEEPTYMSYVIDGHHKLTAYQRTGHNPWVLEISRLRPRLISQAEGAHWLRTSSGKLRQRYKKYK